MRDPHQVLVPLGSSGAWSGGRPQGKKDGFRDDLLALWDSCSSCLTPVSLRFLLGEIPVCKVGGVFSQEAGKKDLFPAVTEMFFVLGSLSTLSESIWLMKGLLALLAASQVLH